jgi:hypothetical protein
MTDAPAGRSKRELSLLKRWYALWPISAAIFLYPINNFPLRLLTIATVAAIWIGLLYFFRRRAIVRIVALIIAGSAVLFLIGPGRDYDADALRRNYVGSLIGYQGTRYVWGGENSLGIDCSGLVRRGLIMANYEQGFSTFNPRLVREGLSLWWHDCSARALGDEYRQRTRFLFSAPGITAADYTRLQPGDLAVTEDGIHVMAYLGAGQWIEADPDVKRVITLRVPGTNAWLSEPVRLVRWTKFERGVAK